MTSEYTHMQELLHESRRLLSEAEKRHDERYASNLETIIWLQAEIAGLVEAVEPPERPHHHNPPLPTTTPKGKNQ